MPEPSETLTTTTTTSTPTPTPTTEPVLNRTEKQVSELMELKKAFDEGGDFGKDQAGTNRLNEQIEKKVAEQMKKASEDAKKSQSPNSSSSGAAEMKMWGRMAIDRMKEETAKYKKALQGTQDKNKPTTGPTNPPETNLLDEKTNEQQYQKVVALEGKIEDLNKVFSAKDDLERVAVWEEIRKKNELPEDQNFWVHVQNVTKEFREMFPDSKKEVDKEEGADAITALEKIADIMIKDGKNLQEADEKVLEKAGKVVEEIIKEVTPGMAPK